MREQESLRRHAAELQELRHLVVDLDAFEAYLVLHPEPQLSFEWAWNLYRCLVSRRELRVVWCALCEGPYVQDAYALDYERCPFCELKDHA